MRGVMVAVASAFAHPAPLSACQIWAIDETSAECSPKFIGSQHYWTTKEAPPREFGKTGGHFSVVTCMCVCVRVSRSPLHQGRGRCAIFSLLSSTVLPQVVNAPLL